MRHSLRLRLLVMTGLVSLVAIAAVAVFSSRMTTRQFDQYIASGTETSLERCRAALTRHYQTRGGWDDAQTTLEQAGSLADRALILVDEKYRVLAVTPPQMPRTAIRVEPGHLVRFDWRETVVTGPGQHEERVETGMLMNTPHVTIENARHETVGILYLVPMSSPEFSHEAVFVGAVNRWLWWAGLLTGAAALLVTFAMSRHILGPIEELTGVAQRLEKGDLSQRVNVRTKDEIGELARAFNAMADGLARTEQLRRNMVSDIAHELRTPLTNLRCQIEALQDGLLAPSAGAFQSLHEEALLMKRLIDDLQDLALAEAGQLRLECVALPVSAVAGQVVGAFAAQAAEKSITLHLAAPTDLPPVYADPERLGQILRNLLANAIAHTPAGGRIDICAQVANEQIEIQVTDTGAGIAPEHLPNIFERFYRVDDSRARATGGAGLGLAIVRQLVIAQGGSVRVKSDLGQSTTIVVALPIARPNSAK